ncbi:hypothetical protein ACUXAV_002420 [Cupriavidus metallidurans]|jgi:hypothetical protein|nr:hypothetical protein [Cupriavidus metallidurans]MDE4920651.1 hypothetical protein [Cupriavidus metallidurans]QGS33047.1 hypothetical protein FOB83_30155 [Cupriavidus metallidurans]UBM07596.1 hypothetical protein LAI70_07635 [Cupriavidus metallidurans]
MRTIHIVDTPRDADRISLIRRRLGPSTLATRQLLGEFIPQLEQISS